MSFDTAASRGGNGVSRRPINASRNDDSTLTSLRSTPAAGSDGGDNRNTPHYHFIHSMLLPSTIKIQRELKSRKFKVRVFYSCIHASMYFRETAFFFGSSSSLSRCFHHRVVPGGTCRSAFVTIPGIGIMTAFAKDSDIFFSFFLDWIFVLTIILLRDLI